MGALKPPCPLVKTARLAVVEETVPPNIVPQPKTLYGEEQIVSSSFEAVPGYVVADELSFTLLITNAPTAAEQHCVVNKVQSFPDTPTKIF